MAVKKEQFPTVVVGEPWDETEFRIKIEGPRVLVGQPWTDDEVVLARHNAAHRRTNVATWLSVFLPVVMALFAAHAVISGDSELTRDILGYVGKGLLMVLAWACGLPLLQTFTTTRSPSSRKSRDQKIIG